MSDLIERQAAIDTLAEHEKSRGHNYTLFVDIVSECAEIIRNLPSAQPERQRGEWIEVDVGDCCYRCSECGFIRDAYLLDMGNYCPKCGARMKGDQ